MVNLKPPNILNIFVNTTLVWYLLTDNVKSEIRHHIYNSVAPVKDNVAMVKHIAAMQIFTVATFNVIGNIEEYSLNISVKKHTPKFPIKTETIINLQFSHSKYMVTVSCDYSNYSSYLIGIKT